MIDLIHGNCFEEMKKIEDGSVDLILTDPPYFGVKSHDWDNQWASANDFIAWLEKVAKEFQRVLKPNGSLFCFTSPQMAARVEVMLSNYFNVLNHIVWAKPRGSGGRVNKSILRRFFNQSERIIFCEHFNSDNFAKCDKLLGFVFEPLRKYLADEWERAGLSRQDANIACEVVTMASSHYFDISQWQLPTPENYAKLQVYANRNGGDYLRREYEDLRREYEDLRRSFNVTPEEPYTDVWTFPVVQYYANKHPCEKPLELIKHIIKTSTRENALILDPFGGSGTTAVAAHNLNRNCICIELHQEYFDIAQQRLAQPNDSK